MVNLLSKLCDGYFGSFNYSYYYNYENLFIWLYLIYSIRVTKSIHLNYANESFSSEISFIF